MSKHTPGPWAMGRPFYTRTNLPQIEVGPTDERGLYITRAAAIATTEADAHLIAEAPNMASLLLELQKYYELLGTTGEFKARLDMVLARAVQ